MEGPIEERLAEMSKAAGASDDEVAAAGSIDELLELSIDVGLRPIGDRVTIGQLAAQMAHGSASVFRGGTYAADEREHRPEEAAQRNLSISPLVDRYLSAFGQIYRHHSRASVRNESVAAGATGELRDLCVGFVDITSSATWASG